ncbi:MAG: hypothetical protein ACR2LS_07825 [Thermomicrobiales bacterium]
MSGLGTTALILAAIWMGALTVIAILLVRQVAILMVRLDRIGTGVATLPNYDPMSEGPDIGARVPDTVAQALPELGTGTSHIVLLSATCGPCRDMAEGLGRADLTAVRKQGRMVALIPGRSELADGLVAMLPPGIRQVRDPQATSLASELSIQRVPFALRVDGGTVTAKAPPLDSTKDLIQFMESERAESNGAAS